MSDAGTAASILVVEDEAAIRRGLGDCLAFHGHTPELIGDGDEGLRVACEQTHDLLILDRMLPGTDGLAICRAARERHPTVGIIVLTARGAEQDVLDGFAAGADDYVTKPFSIAQLMARVEALLRRSAPTAPEPAVEAFSVGRLQVDPATLRAEGPNGSCDLSRRDVDLLGLLLRESGRIVSRRRLLRDLWGYERPDAVETRSVDMHLVKLRRKLKGCGGGNPIETVRGEGYRLAREDAA